ncbi:hypothetical protein L1D14_10735 [Vibrio tubiashii]|uniref:hypothetical protein n=1 Tax=Vibrio tubiashii TaxID=29498 RepID=UPI001EFC6452|nr:hypothetical protein [Vibrio tubiashii]MCG9576714.1 hypothetical protein [Vibrio tubiashii]
MNTQRRQKGAVNPFPLLILSMIVIGMLSDALLTTSDVRHYNQQVDTINKKIDTIVKQAFQYHIDNMAGVDNPLLIGRWPANIQALYDVIYLQQCDPAAQCIPVDRTPWDSAISIEPFTPQDTSDPLNPKDLPAKLRISLNTSGAMGETSADIGLANEIASLYPAANVVGTAVSFEVSRPGVEIVHDALMSRDGSKKPTADWNFDGFKIADMGDVTFKDYRDSSGQPVSLRNSVFDTISLYGHGDYVNMPTCPSGANPKIYLAMAQLVGRNATAVKLGAFQAYALTEPSRWRVQIRYYTQNSSGSGYWEYPRNTEAKALTLTRCES